MEPALEVDRCQGIVSHVRHFELRISKLLYFPENFPQQARPIEVDLQPLLAGSRLERVLEGYWAGWGWKIVRSHIGME